MQASQYAPRVHASVCMQASQYAPPDQLLPVRGCEESSRLSHAIPGCAGCKRVLAEASSPLGRACCHDWRPTPLLTLLAACSPSPQVLIHRRAASLGTQAQQQLRLHYQGLRAAASRACTPQPSASPTAECAATPLQCYALPNNMSCCRQVRVDMRPRVLPRLCVPPRQCASEMCVFLCCVCSAGLLAQQGMSDCRSAGMGLCAGGSVTCRRTAVCAEAS